MILTQNLLNRASEGSVKLAGNYYELLADENMATGDVSTLNPSYENAGYRETQLENGWTLVENEVQVRVILILMVCVPIRVTMGKLSVKIESGDKVLMFRFARQYVHLRFDVKEDVYIDLHCEDNLKPEELIGGTLTYNGWADAYREPKPLPEDIMALRIHGENWPFASHLMDTTTLVRRETTKNATAQIETRVNYVAMAISNFAPDPGDNGPVPHFNLSTKNAPVSFGSDVILHLGAPDVGFQGFLHSDVIVRMDSAGKHTLRTAYIRDDQDGSGQGPPSGNITLTVTGSGELTVVSQRCDHSLQIVGNTFSLLCDSIDMKTDTYQDVSGLTLADNGIVNVVYTYPINYESLSSVWETNDHLWFQSGNESDSLWDDWKYALTFLKTNKEEFAKAVSSDVVNHIFRSLDSVDVTGKARIFVSRQDHAPFAPLYSGNAEKIVCLRQGDINPSDWSIEFNSTLAEFSENFVIFGQYGPSFEDFAITKSSLVQLENQKSCLGVKVDEPPNTAIVTIVYTTNQTYIDILSAFPKYVTLVTNENINSPVTLSNPNTKNVVVLFLDSIQDGKSVILNNLRSDANVFGFGIPFAALDNAFKIIALAYANDTLTSDEYYAKIQELVNPLATEYAKYFPKVSITTNHLSSVFLAGANYVGNRIDSDHFYAVGCTFSSTIAVTALYTSVDTYSYKSLQNVALQNLVLFPVSTSPVDHVSVSTIEFTNDKITLKGDKGYFEFAGAQKGTWTTDVAVANVKGSLHILSFTNSLGFVIPDNGAVTKVKGISAIMGADFDNFQLYDFLPSVPLLSVSIDENPIFGITHRMLSFLREQSRARTLATGKDVTFTGKWDAVEIEGSFSIDAAADPIAVNEVPVAVLQKLQIKSSTSAQIKVPATVKEVHLGTQVVKGFSEMNFASGVAVTFENLTFTAGLPTKIQESSFTLLVQSEEQTLVVNHIKCGEYSRTDLKDVSIQQSLEMGLSSVLTVTQLAAHEFDVVLHYSFAKGFPTFLEGDDIPP